MEPGEIAGLNKTFKIPVENVEDKQPKETDKSESAKKSSWKRFKKVFAGIRKKSYHTIDPDEILWKIQRDRM
ncbi:hypothetical protein TNCV_2784141 [Trichonephila clavipes]|nr:hypothetical protein TNCV_2784141 [Trichonephila clavipes]